MFKLLFLYAHLFRNILDINVTHSHTYVLNKNQTHFNKNLIKIKHFNKNLIKIKPVVVAVALGCQAVGTGCYNLN